MVVLRRLLFLAAVGCLVGACSGSSTSSAKQGVANSESSTSTIAVATTTTVKTFPPDAFKATDALLTQRVRSAGLSGGMLKLVRADGSVIHETNVGSVNGSTPLSVASSTKWLTSAILMTFVDEGLAALDDPVSKWLPEFAVTQPPITIRQLLTHTSGVRDNQCQSGAVALAACVRTITTSPRQFPAGSAFSYGNSPFLVVGRVIEVVGGSDFATVARQRLTGPLGMNNTSWPGAPTAANSAFGVRTTVDDYGKFLDMVLHRGVGNNVRIMDEATFAEFIRNQVANYDTSRDFSVGITKIPRYALGAWPDVVNGFGETRVISGNGGQGLYPWVDFDSETWGIVGVQDDRGAQLAVPASQVVAISAWSVMR